MPLERKTGKAAERRNVKREIKAGRSPKQAVAIAKRVRRQAAARAGGRASARKRKRR